MMSVIRVNKHSPIVAVKTFISAIRDSGYKTTAAALAELVDNSLEAGATHVSITIHPSDDSAPRSTITIVDDGCGMSPAVLQLALQFGGSTRFNSREGAGRYGMGLPCSALSQSRRVDVYSWQSPANIWWTYLDVTAIANGALLEVPRARRAGACRMPTQSDATSGTIVVLSDCDRLGADPQPATETALHRSLGRIFRRALARGIVLSVNGESVRPIDPLFLEGSPSSVRGKPYGPVMEFSIRPPDHEPSIVRVRFSELPVEKCNTFSNAEKAEFGITKGGGVSVVRAGREVDYGWLFMGSKRKENYDDWWRCEVEFAPLLDEWFGLTHTKQRVHPSQALTAILSPHIETVARTLNRRVRAAFQRMVSSHDSSTASRVAEHRDALLEPPSSARRAKQPRGRSLAATITGLHYRVSRACLPDGLLFQPELWGNTLTMTLNTDHPFYRQLVTPLLRSRSVFSGDAIAPLELLLLGYCRAEISLHRNGDKQTAKHLRERWGNALTAYTG